MALALGDGGVLANLPPGWMNPQLLGAGGNGAAFTVDFITGERFVLKVSRIPGPGTLRAETAIYNALRANGNPPGFPRLVDKFTMGDRDCIVMTRLGRTVDAALTARHAGFENDFLVPFALTTLARIRTLHSWGYVHKDIKPDNITFAADNEDPGNMHLIDFGTCDLYWDPRSNNHVKMEYSTRNFTATYAFGTVKVNIGFTSTRKDDLMSFMYTLAKLGTGTLPWLHFEYPHLDGNKQLGMHCKDNITAQKLFPGMSQGFLDAFDYVSQLKEDEGPIYAILENMFRSCAQPANNNN